MRILGIDPGTALTGYAVLDVVPYSPPSLVTAAVVRTSKSLNMHERLKVLYTEMTSLATEYSPDIMVVERLFFNTNVKTAISVGQARGVVLLVAANHNMHLFEYTALEAKMVLTGYGRSKKADVQRAVRDFLELPAIIKPDDAADAVAIALCFLEKNKDFTNILL